jgi:hypothetical protein
MNAHLSDDGSRQGPITPLLFWARGGVNMSTVPVVVSAQLVHHRIRSQNPVPASVVRGAFLPSGQPRVRDVVRFPFEGGTLLHGFEASFKFSDLVLVVCFHRGHSFS